MRTAIFATTGIAVLLATALFSAEAGAQVDIFVQVSGIAGESRDAKHQGWIDATSAEEILKGGGLTTSGGRSSTQAVVESFTIKKRLDKSSPLLKLNLMQNKQIPVVVIEYCKASGDKTNFYTITLKDVVISGMHSTVENGIQQEVVSFDFGRIEWTYVPIDPSGKVGGTVKSAWDLKSNK